MQCDYYAFSKILKSIINFNLNNLLYRHLQQINFNMNYQAQSDPRLGLEGRDAQPVELVVLQPGDVLAQRGGRGRALPRPPASQQRCHQPHQLLL